MQLFPKYVLDLDHFNYLLCFRILISNPVEHLRKNRGLKNLQLVSRICDKYEPDSWEVLGSN